MLRGLVTQHGRSIATAKPRSLKADDCWCSHANDWRTPDNDVDVREGLRDRPGAGNRLHGALLLNALHQCGALDEAHREVDMR